MAPECDASGEDRKAPGRPGGGAVCSASRAAWGGPIAERRDGKAAHVAGNAAVVPIRSHGLKNCLDPQRTRRLAPRLPAGQHQRGYGPDCGKLPPETYGASQESGGKAREFYDFGRNLGA